ncbi:MAG: hypothetical protein HXY34_00360 [Candidatus Thorarchaeota archaeon]|nr:hypothetical protein [Candidatus Thorarchaeota archaeon]
MLDGLREAGIRIRSRVRGRPGPPIVEEVRTLTQFEALAIGPVLALSFGGVLLFYSLFIAQGWDNPRHLIDYLADVRAVASLLFFYPLFHLINYRRARLEAERWIEKIAPILQRELQMREKTEPIWFRIPPKWVDFEEHVCRREKLDDLFKAIQDNSVTMLLALSGAGKTTLTLHLGYELLTKRGWRFVVYWDAGRLGFGDPTECIRGVSDRMAKQGLSNSMALVIIDNVHLTPGLVGKCMNDLRGQFEKNVRCLLVARVTRASVAEDKKEWERLLRPDDGYAKSAQEESGLSYFTLESDDFEKAIKQIVESYSESLEDREELMRQYTSKSRESLVLLKFLLSDVGTKHAGDVEQVKKADLKKSLCNYYEYSVIRGILDAMKPENYDQLRVMVRRVLLFVSIYSSMEIPAYRPLLCEVLEPQASQRMSPGIINILWDRGDLVGTENDLLHPHLSIAEELPRVYPDEFKDVKKSFEQFLSMKLMRSGTPLQIQAGNPVGPKEQAIIAVHHYLLTNQEEDRAAVILAMSMRHLAKDLSKGMYDYLMSIPAEFAAGLAKVDTAYDLMIVLRRVRALNTTTGCDKVAGVLASAILDSDEPWLVIWAIKDWRELREKVDIRSAVMSSVPKLASAIRQSNKLWLMVQLVGSMADRSNNQMIEEAVQCRLPEIREYLSSSEAEHSVIEGMLRIGTIRNDAECQKALKDAGLYDRYYSSDQL